MSTLTDVRMFTGSALDLAEPVAIDGNARDRWIGALESGRYTQCYGQTVRVYLGDYGGSVRMNCAVGVLYEESGTMNNRNRVAQALRPGPDTSEHDPQVWGLLQRVVNLNDNVGLSFPEIAAWLRRNTVPLEAANIGEPEREYEEPEHDVPAEFPAPAEPAAPAPEREPVPA